MFRNIMVGLVGSMICLVTQVNAERLDAVASVVNGQVVTCYEVEVAQTALQQQLAQQGGALPSAKDLYKRALESRVMRALQYQEADNLGIKIRPEEVDAAITDVETRNKLQPGQLEAVLKAQGVDMISYRESLEDRLLNTRLINIAVRSKLSVSAETMREYYRKHLKNPKEVREVRISQFFLALPTDASSGIVESTRQKAETFLKSLQQGADFKRLVTLKSDAPDTSTGGDMGWISPGAVSGAITQVFQLQVGGLSSVVRSAAGFHIFSVTAERMRKPQNTEAYDEVHARHILIKVPDSAELSTQVKIRERVEKIAKEMQGTSDEAFVVRAKELSQGPSASRGGDLGWFKRGSMVPAFEEVAFVMKPGDTSGVVTSQFGLHVIRLVDKRTVNPNAFEARKGEIEKLLLDSEMQQQVPRWMNSLKENASFVDGNCANVSSAVLSVVGGDAVVVDQKETQVISRESTKKTVDQDVGLVLEKWESAWETQQFEAYFDVYNQTLSPDKRFSTFEKWQAYKRRVIAKHKDIEISLSNVEEKVIEQGKRVRFTFDQHFKSNKTNDHDRKSLELQKVDGQWKIISEATIQTL
ncbi:MAG: peptidylprolyl isomerase [Ghiorsea sp.]